MARAKTCGNPRQRALRADPGEGARLGGLAILVGVLAGSNGAVPHTSSMTPCRPVGTRCWLVPLAFITNKSKQHRSGYRRSLEKAIRSPSGAYTDPPLLWGYFENVRWSISVPSGS